MRRRLRILWVSFLIVIVDQITKLWVKGISIPGLGIEVAGMRYGTSIPVLGDFFRLTYIENPGMAFGIDLGGKLFFSLFSIALSFGILYYLLRARTERLGLRLSLALILGGAIGNMIDRTFYAVLFDEGPLFYGKVVDFLDVDFFDINILGFSLHRWPVFNVADACVTVGIAMLLIMQTRHESRARSSSEASASAAAPSNETNSPASNSPQ